MCLTLQILLSVLLIRGLDHLGEILLKTMVASSTRVFKVVTWALYCTGLLVVFWVRSLVRDQDFSEVDEFARLLARTRNSLFSDPQLAQQLESVKDFDKERLWPFNSSKDVKGYLIHVGKAGGSSLQYRLNVLDAIPILPCRMNSTSQEQEESCIKRKDKSILKQRMFASFHTFSSRYKPVQKQWLRSNTNLLIFTVRDPGKLHKASCILFCCSRYGL